ncbi:MAG: hypothetical protein JXQ72_11990 [Anaerolineae bacterium]|nr:hypothetical protein [Anaerolineae bacterium]
MPKSRSYHPDYRSAEVSQIVATIDRGQSVSIIGPPSVGKSNLLLFLDQRRLSGTDPNSPWFRHAPLSETEGRIVAIYIDPNALLPALPSARGKIAAQAWPGFELLTHRTAVTRPLFPRVHGVAADNLPPDLAVDIVNMQERFESAHPDVTAMDDALHAHMALRHLENIIDAALAARSIQNTPVRIAYFFDEFERMLNALPDFFFVALRSIRDRFKGQVMFVTVTRNSLPYLIPDYRMAEMEPFVELFHDAAIYLKPFNDDDAWRMIEDMEGKTSTMNDYAVGLLIRATGGFAGLLRAGFYHVEKLAPIQSGDYQHTVDLAAIRLAAEPNIQEECKTLLRSLNAEEIKTLYGAAVRRPDLPGDTMRELSQKSLLTHDTVSTGLQVAPPVLAAYIRNHPTPPSARPVPRPVTLPEEDRI